MIDTPVVEQLRERARTYELNSLAAADRGDVVTATSYTTVAITLFEIADSLEEAA